MDFQKQRNLLEILDEIWALAPEDQPAFLDRVCGENASLRQDIQACIESDAKSWLRLQKFRASPFPKERIGPYLLTKPLGEGGMGVVFLAARADGAYHQEVAIKVLKTGTDHQVVLQRFLAERQILAQLNHPHIAKLLDGGTTEEGLPYLVMEYVEGIPITHYCETHQLSLPQRLQLFLKVCQALAYAQNNLIIHRDIKPSNVLVTASGKPMLLDFGIAKLLRPPSLSEATRTLTENRIMTPIYASPEQLNGDAVTTALDVYGLGLLLYELLTGERPFQLENRPLQEVTQTICEVPPVKPSSLVGHFSKQHPTTPSNSVFFNQKSASRIKKWAASLKGDLDHITLKALRKKPRERYSSVALLVEDLERYFDCLPVHAHQENATYVLKKFCTRHRLALAMTGLFMILGFAFVSHLLIQRHQLQSERARVIAERDKAKDMMGYLITLFSIPNTSQEQNRMTVNELLEQGVERIQRGSYAPTTQADLMTTMGILYRGLGQYEPSEKLLSEGLSLRQASPKTTPEDWVLAINELGKLHLAKGGFEEAENIIKTALSHLENLPAESLAITQTYTVYSQALKELGDFANAALYAEKALHLQRKQLVNNHPDVAITLNQMAQIQEVQGDFTTALIHLKEALNIAQNRSGENPGLPFEVLLNMASVYQTQGEYLLAKDAYLQVLAWQKKTLGPTHPEVALTLHNLGTLYESFGQISQAKAMFLQSLDINKKIHGDDSPFVGTILYSLSNIYYVSDQLEKAKETLLEVIRIDTKTLGVNHINLAFSYGFLAAIQAKTKNHEPSHTHYQKALAILSENVGDTHQQYALMLGNYGDALRLAGDFHQAEIHLRRSLALFENQLGRKNIHTAHALGRLAKLLNDTASLEAAEALYREAYQNMEASKPTDELAVLGMKKRLAECLAKQGRFTEGEAYFLEAHRYVSTLEGPHFQGQYIHLIRAMIGFYESWGKETQVATYQKVLANLETKKANTSAAVSK